MLAHIHCNIKVVVCIVFGVSFVNTGHTYLYICIFFSKHFTYLKRPQKVEADGIFKFCPSFKKTNMACEYVISSLIFFDNEEKYHTNCCLLQFLLVL